MLRSKQKRRPPFAIKFRVALCSTFVRSSRKLLPSVATVSTEGFRIPAWWNQPSPSKPRSMYLRCGTRLEPQRCVFLKKPSAMQHQFSYSLATNNSLPNLLSGGYPTSEVPKVKTVGRRDGTAWTNSAESQDRVQNVRSAY